MGSTTPERTDAQPDRGPDRVTSVRPARRSGKYLRTSDSTPPICVGLRLDKAHCRQFVRQLLLAHDYLVPERQPCDSSNELYNLVLVLGGELSIAACDELEKLQTALEIPVLVAAPLGSATGSLRQLEFPCRFEVLEARIAESLGRETPARKDIHPDLGVNVEYLLSAFTPTEANIFRVLYKYQGALAPRDELLLDGFGGIISEESMHRGVRNVRSLLRLIALDAERSNGNRWRLVMPA